VSLCPFATHRLLPESGTQPRITPRVAILHSAAGKGSLYRFFLERSALESHFWVDEDGEIEQYVDTHVRADANLKANGYAISIETESTVAATERWTPRQAAAIIRLLEWICDEHPDVTRRQVAAPAGSGIGWHVMFGAPGPWTPVAKSCPGPARVAQARDEIIPAIVAGDPHNPYPKPEPKPPTVEDDDMATAHRDPRDGKVWIVSGAGRWHVPNRDRLNELVALHLVKPFGDQPPKWPAQVIAALDHLPVIAHTKEG